ncbi:hypothetical protein [Photobacterium damselae]|uniref:hypothetical protein n=1 Tax=Photobacterium damselae TaxID=38293 RepID=UPI000566B10F|nr:hypothetical protein [Photobacterium damselae]PSW79345.1 hypothetical protein CTN07_20695 [Photobacterium damselae]
MIFEKDTIIESFCHQFPGLAAIRRYDGLHMLINEQWKKTIGPVANKTLSYVLNKTSDPILITNIKYCLRCDEEAIYRNQMTCHFEFFNNQKYATMRIPVLYKNKQAILILGVIHH